jgi:hypothetical protein
MKSVAKAPSYCFWDNRANSGRVSGKFQEFHLQRKLPAKRLPFSLHNNPVIFPLLSFAIEESPASSA